MDKSTLISAFDTVTHSAGKRNLLPCRACIGFREVLNPVSDEKGGSNHVQGMNLLSDVLFISPFSLSNS